jgi:hypothetical protein
MISAINHQLGASTTRTRSCQRQTVPSSNLVAFSRAERQCCRGGLEHPRRPYHVQGACHGVAEGSGAKGLGSGSRTYSPEQLQAAYRRRS